MRCSCCLFHLLDFASSDAVSQRDDCRNSAWPPCQQETRSFPLLWWYHQGKARPWRCSLLTVLTSCLMVLSSQRKARVEQPMAERRLRHISPDGVTRKAGKENVLSPAVRWWPVSQRAGCAVQSLMVLLVCAGYQPSKPAWAVGGGAC